MKRLISLAFLTLIVSTTSGCSQATIHKPTFAPYGEQITFELFQNKYASLYEQYSLDYFTTYESANRYSFSNKTKSSYCHSSEQKYKDSSTGATMVLYSQDERFVITDPIKHVLRCKTSQKTCITGDRKTIKELKDEGNEDLKQTKGDIYLEHIGSSLYRVDLIRHSVTIKEDQYHSNFFSYCNDYFTSVSDTATYMTGYEENKYYANRNTLTFLGKSQTMKYIYQFSYNKKITIKSSVVASNIYQVESYKVYLDITIEKTSQRIERIDYTQYQ